MVKTMTAGSKVLFLSVKEDTGMRRKILWLIGRKNLKAERKKNSRKRKVSTSEEDSDSLSTDSSSPKKGKENQTSVTSSTDIAILLNCQRFKYR